VLAAHFWSSIFVRAILLSLPLDRDRQWLPHYISPCSKILLAGSVANRPPALDLMSARASEAGFA
jgi:hypothetical protein